MNTLETLEGIKALCDNHSRQLEALLGMHAKGKDPMNNLFASGRGLSEFIEDMRKGLRVSSGFLAEILENRKDIINDIDRLEQTAQRNHIYN